MSSTRRIINTFTKIINTLTKCVAPDLEIYEAIERAVATEENHTRLEAHRVAALLNSLEFPGTPLRIGVPPPDEEKSAPSKPQNRLPNQPLTLSSPSR